MAMTQFFRLHVCKAGSVVAVGAVNLLSAENVHNSG